MANTEFFAHDMINNKLLFEKLSLQCMLSLVQLQQIQLLLQTLGQAQELQQLKSTTSLQGRFHVQQHGSKF